MPRVNPETKFKIEVQKRLKEIPDLWVVKIQMVALRGIPDLLICYKGMLYAWELKTLKGVVEPLQQHVLNNINKAGGIARVVSPANLEECMEELVNGKRAGY